MPGFVNGLPTHVLVVHAAVVLLPLSILAALVLVFVPAARKAFGLLTVCVAFVACLAVPLAFASGGDLRGRLPPSSLIDQHVKAAHVLAVAAAIFGLALTAFVAVDLVGRAAAGELNRVEAAAFSRLRGGGQHATRRAVGRLRLATAVLLVLTSVATGVAVTRAGDTGARAAWHGRLAATSPAPPASESVLRP